MTFKVELDEIELKSLMYVCTLLDFSNSYTKFCALYVQKLVETSPFHVELQRHKIKKFCLDIMNREEIIPDDINSIDLVEKCILENMKKFANLNDLREEIRHVIKTEFKCNSFA